MTRDWVTSVGIVTESWTQEWFSTSAINRPGLAQTKRWSINKGKSIDSTLLHGWYRDLYRRLAYYVL